MRTAKLENTLSELQKEANEQNQKFVSLSQNLAALEVNFTKQSERVTSLDKKITSQDSCINNLEQRLNNEINSGYVSAHENQLITAEEQVSFPDDQVNSLNKTVYSQVNGLEQQVIFQNGMLPSLDERVTSQNTGLKQQVTRVLDQVSSLDQRLASHVSILDEKVTSQMTSNNQQVICLYERNSRTKQAFFHTNKNFTEDETFTSLCIKREPEGTERIGKITSLDHIEQGIVHTNETFVLSTKKKGNYCYYIVNWSVTITFGTI